MKSIINLQICRNNNRNKLENVNVRSSTVIVDSLNLNEDHFPIENSLSNL